ncbi:MAG: winged helix-turn-helix domain-containing protein [Caldilineaceae bacterium]
MISVKFWKVLTVITVGVAGFSALFMIMDWFGYWGQGEYEFAFSISGGLILLFLVSLLVAALCWRVYRLELIIDKFKRKQVKFYPKSDDPTAAVIESLEETSLSEQQVNAHVLATPPPQSAKDYILAIHKNKVYRGNEELELSPKEFTLIKLLIESGGLCSTEEIIANVWSEEGASNNRTSQDLNQLIRRLRKKINIDGHDFIDSHPGRGYEFRQWSGQ